MRFLSRSVCSVIIEITAAKAFAMIHLVVKRPIRRCDLLPGVKLPSELDGEMEISSRDVTYCFSALAEAAENPLKEFPATA